MSAPTAKRTRATKPQGQWLIDGTSPLNRDEEIKQESEIWAVKQRIIDTYSK